MRYGRFTRRAKGFTLVELLLSLAISAMLLAAAAAAFNASVTNYQENQEIYQALNNARQAMLRMTTQLRTGQAVTLDVPADPNRCRFSTSDGEDITYEYQSDSHQLVLITNADGQEYVLCENVTDQPDRPFFIKTAIAGLCKSVRISMTVQSGNQTQTLSSAVVIRRNLEL